MVTAGRSGSGRHEFDYSVVHALIALQWHGREAVIAVNNLETVSTDFDVSDGLYLSRLRGVGVSHHRA
ncbi:MAG: hypothetical protein H7A35_13725 [Planctomycetales bacterium]|nr:MAG: hypothetical protein H7A35_13725 [Planctomycetales bacterium]